MKGVQGLVIAIVLGLIGAAVNWKYLADQSKEKHASFVIVKPGQKVQQGQKFRPEDVEVVQVPEDLAGPLTQIAWNDVDYVIKSQATRDYAGPALILREELKTVSRGPLPLDPKKNEFAIGVPIDNGTFVSSLIIPGKTLVKFLMPRSGPAPTGAAENTVELVGPYEVLSVGNRRGEEDTMRSGSIRPKQDNVLMIRGRGPAPGQYDPLTSRLMNYRNKSGDRPLDVVLWPEPAPSK